MLASLLLALEPARSMRIAEALHVDGLDAHSLAAAAALARTGALAGIFFALAPLVEGEILTAHCFGGWIEIFGI